MVTIATFNRGRTSEGLKQRFQEAGGEGLTFTTRVIVKADGSGRVAGQRQVFMVNDADFEARPKDL